MNVLRYALGIPLAGVFGLATPANAAYIVRFGIPVCLNTDDPGVGFEHHRRVFHRRYQLQSDLERDRTNRPRQSALFFREGSGEGAAAERVWRLDREV